MKTIWKYTLSPKVEIDIPIGAKILDVQLQFDRLQMWVLVDPTAKTVKRTFCMYGTGHKIDGHPGDYIGTFQVGGGTLVFHVFETTVEGK